MSGKSTKCKMYREAIGSDDKCSWYLKTILKLRKINIRGIPHLIIAMDRRETILKMQRNY
jgi:hypothetical protein